MTKIRLIPALCLLLAGSFQPSPACAVDAEAPLSLDQCLELAYRNSPELASSRQQVFSAQATVLGAYGNFLPSFDSSAGYNHQFVGPKPASLQYNTITQEFFIQDPIASRDYETYSFSLSGNLTLFSGFSRWADLKSQKLDLAATRADLDQTRHQVESGVIQAYYDLVKAQMMVELNRSSLEANREQFEQSRRAFTMGAVARSDTLRASVRYAEARLTLLESENSLALARLSLATVIGAEPGRPLSVQEPPVPRFVRVVREEAIRAALETHPTLKAAAYRHDASRQTIRQAKAGLWPYLGASYRYSWYDLSPPTDALHVFQEDYSYTLSLNLGWTLFDGFSTKRNINQARANARVQEYNLEQQRRSIIQSVESTLVTLDNSRKRVELARATIELAREDLRLARERYRVGAATLLEVTEAEVSLIQGRANEIEGVTNYLGALAELERATGIDLDGR